MKIIQTKTQFETKFLNLYETEYEDTKSNIKYWNWAGRPNNRKAVMIVAEVIGDCNWVLGAGYQQDNKLAVIKEFRVPINDYEYGFPAGLIDDNEPLETTIKRELKEETNLDLVHINKVTPFVYNTAGLTNESIAVAYVEAKGTLSKENLEASEDIESYLLNRYEIAELLKYNNKKFGAKAYLILNQYATFGRLL